MSPFRYFFVFNRLCFNYDRFTVKLAGYGKLEIWLNYDKFTVGLSGRGCLQTSCRFIEGRQSFVGCHRSDIFLFSIGYVLTMTDLR